VKALIGATLLGLLTVPANAVVTATWSVETYQQFDAGDASSAFITSSGEVRPGWDTKRIALEGDAVWSALHLADGSVLLGSDVGGAIFRASGDAAKKVVTVPGAIAIVALTQTADGSVWAGSMPGNKLWKIEVAGGKATPGPQLKDTETIWSLASAGNTVYAGTGPSGKVFAISGGTAKEIFDTDDKRVTAITTTSDGAVWFGTSERALVFRYDPKDGKTRAMADFAGNEVTAIAAYRDGVVVAANDLVETPAAAGKTATAVDAAEKPNAAKGQAAKPPDVGTKPGADKDPSPVTDLGRKGAKKGKGALFKVSQVWFDHGLLGFATDDSAAIYRATGRAAAAKYMSDVMDAKAVAKFGKVTWVSSGKVKVETRSGNTAKPGVGWSEWQAPSAVGKLGGDSDGGKIASPPGRYLQFRTALEDDQARVRRVLAYYVPQNTATTVQEVTVEIATKESLPTLKDTAAKPRSPVLRVKWKIDNTDSDDTTYTLDARRDGEANWRPVGTGKVPLTVATWEWNTETYPDGWYKVRVTSSDAAANSPDRAELSRSRADLER